MPVKTTVANFDVDGHQNAVCGSLPRILRGRKHMGANGKLQASLQELLPQLILIHNYRVSDYLSGLV